MPPSLTADLVIRNAKVWTVDPALPSAEAVAIAGGRIVAVGGNSGVQEWAGPKTRVVDAAGASVLPGFNDAHVHFVTGGFHLQQVDLRDAATPEEFSRRVATHARKLPKGQWILGGHWDHELWGGAPPSREWLDTAAPDHPLFVARYDMHSAVANSVALQAAGITASTPDPDGGTIAKNARGEPTGFLKDSAMGLVYRVIPPHTEEHLLAVVRAALGEARRLGVTSVQDISRADYLRAYHKLCAAGELTARIYAITPIEQWEATLHAGLSAGFGNPWLRTGALKAFSDGSLGSTTALFFDPYNDAPHTCGLAMPVLSPDGNLERIAIEADRAGLQLVFHAIGDRANRIVLDIFAAVARRNGPRDRRCRVEHAQHLHPADFPRFRELGVIASMQPSHVIDDGRWAEKRIGRERMKTTMPCRSLLDHGARLALGTDWTVAPLDPLLTLYAAVTRATLDGKHPGGWVPEQKITLAEAIEAYTMGSAYAEGTESWKGSLTVGKAADVVVLDRDLFATPPENLRDAKVRMTITAGNVVYEA